MNDLSARLIEAAAGQIALAANEGSDWPVRDEDRHDARMVLAAVLPLLAEAIDADAQTAFAMHDDTGRRFGEAGMRRTARLIREATP